MSMPGTWQFSLSYRQLKRLKFPEGFFHILGFLFGNTTKHIKRISYSSATDIQAKYRN